MIDFIRIYIVIDLANFQAYKLYLSRNYKRRYRDDDDE